MKFFNKINKAIATTALSTGILASSIIGTNLIKNARDYTVYALPYGSQEVSKISDNDFSNFSGTTYGSPSNWTSTSDSDKANKERFVSGIMNLTSSTAWSSNYEENFHLRESDNPTDDSVSDKNFLYINNFSSAPVKYGYASESFTLAKNSYYRITTRLKTVIGEHSEAKASLYVTGLSETIKMEDIYTNGSWKEYTFYIATNSINDASSIKLEIWLGNKETGSYGAIFADKVEVFQYDESTFKSEPNKDSSTSVYTNLNEHVSNPFANNGFESDLTGWKLSESNSVDSDNQFIDSVLIGTGFDNNITTNWNATNPYSINSFNNNRALLISNKTDLISGIESPNISIAQHGLYKISIWAYSNCNTGNGATILASEVGLQNTTKAFTTMTTKTTVTENAVTSNWTEYNVYVQGSAYKDTEIKLHLFLGAPAIGENEASPTSGWVYFDEIRIQQINYADYSSATTNLTNACELNVTTSNTQFIVPNNGFNKAQNEDVAITYPLIPQNFTKKVIDIDGKEVTDAVTYSGIVNVNTTHWNNHSADYPNDVYNPGTFNGKSTDESTNNVLMIGTKNHTIKQTYTSDSFALDASSYYKVSFYVQTQILPQYNSGASVIFYDGPNYIHKLDNINTHGEWQYHEFYIKTGDLALSSTFELGLSYNSGYAFFDDLHVQKFDDEESFNSVVTTSDKVYDLTYENFDTQNSFNGYFDSTYITENEQQMLTSGVKELNGNNVLYISSTADTYYTFSSSRSYSLTQGSYYAISVDVYTEDLTQEEHNYVYDEDGNKLPFGVSIALKNSTSTFTHKIENINTSTVNNGHNKFTTYTFYINASETIDVYLYLSLGNVGSFVSGNVYFDNVRFDTTLTADDYNAKKLDTTIENVSLFIESTEENNTGKADTEEAPAEEKEPFEFPWILASSLITGVAIIIAIVGYFIRKATFRKTPKVKTSYDRRKTLDVDLDRRERIAMRQSMIEELKLQLHTIDDEIEAIKEMFDVKEAQILLNDKARREQIEKDRKEIVAKREDATKEYKSILNSDVTDKEKQVAERHFAKYIAKLNKQEETLQKLLEKKETSSALLKIKREQELQRFIDAQINIQKEIERIEQEIEQIAKEDEQIWADYKKAKAEAKERKTAYIQEKKLEKAKAKSSKSTKKVEAKEETVEVAKETAEENSSNTTSEE